MNSDNFVNWFYIIAMAVTNISLTISILVLTYVISFFVYSILKIIYKIKKNESWDDIFKNM